MPNPLLKTVYLTPLYPSHPHGKQINYALKDKELQHTDFPLKYAFNGNLDLLENTDIRA